MYCRIIFLLPLSILILSGLFALPAFAIRDAPKESNAEHGDMRGQDRAGSGSPSFLNEDEFFSDAFRTEPSGGSITGPGVETEDGGHVFTPGSTGEEDQPTKIKYKVGDREVTVEVPAGDHPKAGNGKDAKKAADSKPKPKKEAKSKKLTAGSQPETFSDAAGLELEDQPIDYRNGSESTTTTKQPGLPKYSDITIKRGALGTSDGSEFKKMIEHKMAHDDLDAELRGE